MRCPPRCGRATTNGRLIFVNAAYARAVDAEDADRRGRARARTARPRGARRSSRARAPAATPMPSGCRRSSPASAASSTWSTRRAAPAAPAWRSTRTEVETMRAELARMIEAHRRVLDQLATGVAIFNVDRKLIFYNAAFRSLFELDAGFLDQTPTDSRRARHAARRPQAAGGAGLPAVEAAAARGLSRGRAEGAPVAPAGRPHAARRHHAQSGGRRHLSLRRRHRAARHAPPLRRADQGAERDARSPGRSGRGVRQRRPRAAAQSGVPAHVEARARGARPASARRSGDRLGAGAARRQYGVAQAARRGDRDRQPRADRRAHRTARRHDDRHDHHAAARRRDARHLPGRHRHASTSSARCARRTRRWRPPTPSRSISCTTCPTNCARRSPTSSASRISSAIRPSARSPTSSANISATSPPRPTRCWR